MLAPFIRKPDLIPRYSVPMCQRFNTTIENPDDPFAENNKGIQFNQLVCKNVTIQPIEAYKMTLLPAGLSSKECYTLYSENVMFSVLDNSDRLGDAIYIPSSLINRTESAVDTERYEGGWFTVIRAKNWFTGVIPHSESVIVRDTTVDSFKGYKEYPVEAIEALLPAIDTISKLRGNKWHKLWENDK